MLLEIQTISSLAAGNNTTTQEYVEPVSPTTALPLPLPTDVQIKSQRHFYRRRSAWGAIKSKIQCSLSRLKFLSLT